MKRRWLIPEVVQTSAMDCGPAALKSLLEGFGVTVSYGRLREACQTSVDGTSIDTLEDVAVSLGLDAEQTIIPHDHVYLTETDVLPALIVVLLPNGFTHFVVIWRRWGHYVQVMDPATGRRWLYHSQLPLYRHTMSLSAEIWRVWAAGDEFVGGLRHRMRDLHIDAASQARLLEQALADPGWSGLAVLDAAIRFAARLVSAKAVPAGKPATRLVQMEVEASTQLPDDCFSVRAAPPAEDGTANWLSLGQCLSAFEE